MRALNVFPRSIFSHQDASAMPGISPPLVGHGGTIAPRKFFRLVLVLHAKPERLIWIAYQLIKINSVRSGKGFFKFFKFIFIHTNSHHFWKVALVSDKTFVSDYSCFSMRNTILFR